MASIEMPFEMPNLNMFPMEKLCFDLKLEVLEQMEPLDVLKLAKVNKEFQGMLVRDLSIIFGKHVSRIELCGSRRMRIKKFSNSDAMELNDDRPFSHFSFIKNIRSCDRLLFRKNQINEKCTLLNNLKSVNRLEWNSQEPLEKFFSDFHASIKKKAELNIGFDVGDKDDQVIKDLIENFIVTQLKDCEKIEIVFQHYSEDLFCFYYNALLKTQIKNVYMPVHSYSSHISYIDWISQQIVTKGIPSKNPEAAIWILSYHGLTIDLSQSPGMRRIDGENRLRLLKQANDLLENFGIVMESSIFRRRIDSTKDCIYVYQKRYRPCIHRYFFLAFYVSID